MSEALSHAADELVKGGVKPSTTVNSPGQAVVFLAGLKWTKVFRPTGWQQTAATLLKHDIPFLRALTLQSIPVVLDDTTVELVAACIKDEYAPVQGCACDLIADRSRLSRFRQPLMDVLRVTPNEWVLRSAFRAAAKCGADMDQMLEILIDRLERRNNNRNLVLLELMVDGAIKHEGRSGAQSHEDWQGFLSNMQQAWRKFIVTNRQALREGKRLPLGDQTITPEMFPPGFHLYLKGQPWPSEPKQSLGKSVAGNPPHGQLPTAVEKKNVRVQKKDSPNYPVESTANKDGSFTFKLHPRADLVSVPEQSVYMRFLSLSDKPLKNLKGEPKYQSKKPLYGELELGVGPNNKFAVVVDETESQNGMNAGKRRILIDRNRDRNLANDGFSQDASDITLDGPYPSGIIPYVVRFLRWSNHHNAIGYELASCREGKIRLDGKEYKIVVQDENFDGRFDDLEQGILVIDLNQDGKFEGDRYVTPDLSSAELFKLNEPFDVHGKAWQIAPVSPDGLSITLRPSHVKANPKPYLTQGNKSPDFTVADLDGKPIHLADEAAKAKCVLLHFWKSSSRYSQLDFYILRKLQAQYKDHGLKIIGVSSDQDVNVVRDIMKEYSLAYPQVRVPNDSMSVKTLYRVLGYSQSYLIDSHGTIVARGRLRNAYYSSPNGESEVLTQLHALLGPGDEAAAAKAQKESDDFEKAHKAQFVRDSSIKKTYCKAKGFSAVVVPRPFSWDECDVRAAALHLPYVYVLCRAGRRENNLLTAKVSSDVNGPPKVECVGMATCINDGTDLIATQNALLCPKNGGVAVYSLADPAHPAFVKTVSSNHSELGYRSGTFVFDNANLFILDESQLIAFNAADPLSPRFLATLPVQTIARNGCILSGRMYAASSKPGTGKMSWGISIYDVSKPQEPQELGFVPTGDDLAYQLLPINAKQLVATMTRSISLYSLDDPLKPTLLGSPVKFDKPSGRTAAMFSAGGKSFAMVNGTVYLVEPRELKKYGDFTWGGNADGFPYRAAVQDNCIAITSGAFVTLLFADAKVLGEPSPPSPPAGTAATLEQASVAPKSSTEAIKVEKEPDVVAKVTKKLPADEAAVVEARKVLEDVAAAYKTLDTYKAEGTVKVDMETGSTKTSMETSFSILLKKPNLYRISWSQKNDRTPLVQSGAVWCDGTQPYLYLDAMQAYSKMKGDEMALGAATGVSGGAAMTIASRFLPVFKQPQTSHCGLIDPKIETTEKIDGEECYVISGSSLLSPKETFWISKSRQLILKCSRSLAPPEGGLKTPELTEKQFEEAIRGMGLAVTEENKKSMRERMAQSMKLLRTMKIRGTSTEVQRNISSPQLKKEDFAFTPPKDAVLKESLFGGLLRGRVSKSLAEAPQQQNKTPPVALNQAKKAVKPSAIPFCGTVVDVRGVPLANATVSPLSREKPCGAVSNQDAKTDAKGQFALNNGPDGAFHANQSVPLRVVTDSGHTFEVNPTVSKETTVHVPTLLDDKVKKVEKVDVGELAGTVVDESGKPIAGVDVDVWDWCPGNETKTDENGFFHLKGFDRNERVEVRFRKSGYSPETFFHAPTGVAGWVVVLGSKTSFEGVVRGPDDKPVPHALVRADQGPRRCEGCTISTIWTETTADAEGRFRLYVQPDRYHFTITAAGVGVTRFTVAAIDFGQHVVLDFIKLEPGATFLANVVDSETGKPVEGVRLWNWQHKQFDGRSNADGMVTIADMPLGRFQFEVEAKGYRRWWSESCESVWARKLIGDSHSPNMTKRHWQRNFDALDFDLRPAMNSVEIVLEKGVHVRGRVVDPEGKPVVGATVAPALTGTGNSLTGDTRFSVETKEDGRFNMLLPASNEAQYNLVAHDGKFQQWRNWANGVLPPIRTKPGEEINDVVLKLTRPATVCGKVVDKQGNPMPYCEVRAHAVDKQENRYYDPTTKTAADGTFELKFIRPAEQFIQAAPFWLDAEQSPVGSSKRLNLEAGQTLKDVQLVTEKRP